MKISDFMLQLKDQLPEAVWWSPWDYGFSTKNQHEIKFSHARTMALICTAPLTEEGLEQVTGQLILVFG